FADTYAEMVDYVLMCCRKRYAAQLTTEGAYDRALVEYALAIEPAARFAARHILPGLGTNLINKALEVHGSGLGVDGEPTVRAVLRLRTAEPVVTGIIGTFDERAAFVRGLGQHIMGLLITSGSPEGKVSPDLFAEHHLLFKGFDFRLFSQNPGPRPSSPYVD